MEGEAVMNDAERSPTHLSAPAKPSSRALVVIDADELERRIEEAVRRALTASHRQEPQWIDAEGAAALLGVHPRTVTRLAKSGRLASRRIGRLLRFERAAVLAWLERESG